METSSPVAIALGSNQGDRERILHGAISSLRVHLSDLRFSTFHETEPVGVGPQPRFLNAAVTGTTALAPGELLEALQDIEGAYGRQRPYPGAPRTLDLDLVLYGARTIDLPWLVVPHPRFRERRFVLAPLAEIAADWRDPVTGRTIEELLGDLAPEA